MAYGDSRSLQLSRNCDWVFQFVVIMDLRIRCVEVVIRDYV